jgi:hypothetical protein
MTIDSGFGGCFHSVNLTAARLSMLFLLLNSYILTLEPGAQVGAGGGDQEL